MVSSQQTWGCVLGSFALIRLVKSRLPRNAAPPTTVDFTVFRSARLVSLEQSRLLYRFWMCSTSPDLCQVRQILDRHTVHLTHHSQAFYSLGCTMAGLAADRFSRFDVLTIRIRMTLTSIIAVLNSL
ncbi:hypothetical protein K461DRAFT_130041 [Myriangium duriaei CBS 260.36]|uniref:Uncharacterized protein n=1 Tax=Myriangium duriaei CBS 260.36 TaxID=1168546 RepID=A0A9P4J2Y4_9PEZI|nr:hypothetical protein K461DRAFT_130041 [Myriangium duriaei CBS 260.36]